MKKKGAWWLMVSVLVVLVALLPWTMAAQELPLPEAGVPSLQQGTGPNFCIPTFGTIRENNRFVSWHEAIDIGGGQPAGGTPVYAAHAGRVVYVGRMNVCEGSEFPYAVAIKYPGQINGKYVLTVYNHMGHGDSRTGWESYVDVSVGQEVRKGQPIGRQGDAPACDNNIKGVHLHFAVYEYDQPFLDEYTSWGKGCDRDALFFETGGKVSGCALPNPSQPANPELSQYLGPLPTDSEKRVEETCSQYYKDTTGQQTATVLVMDISGSMGDHWRGGVKIESAKAAALDIVNMIEQESQVGSVEHQVAVVTFSDYAWLDLPLTTDYNQAREAISSLHATDRTNIGAGLETANEALQQAVPDSKKVVILLSDGKTNEGLSPDGILSGPLQEAMSVNTCIYTIGFGDPGDLDEDLLRSIADASGCGKYYYASDPFDLRKEYAASRHDSLGTLIADLSGQVGRGETQQVGQIEVPPNQGELYVSLIWPGSQLDLILTDPRGQTVDANYPGATIAAYTRLVYLIVTNPLPGLWQISVLGRDVPAGMADYAVLASVREKVAPPPSPLPPPPELGDGSALAIALTVVIAITAVVAGFYTLGRRGLPGPAPAEAGVRVVGGAAPLKSKGFRRATLHMGRDPRNELVLADEKVSRRHARIVRTRDGYLLEDLNSQNGTFVNGEQVTRKQLHHGDEIRVGDTRLVFQRRR